MPRSATPSSAGKRGLNMNFNHEELMLMMLYNTHAIFTIPKLFYRILHIILTSIITS